jgi:hypothetical protein
MKVSQSSPDETPEKDIMFVVEYPADVTRIKMRRIDIEREVATLQKNIEVQQARIDELLAIDAEIEKIKEQK